MQSVKKWQLATACACIFWGISGLFGKALFNASSQADALWLCQVRMIISALILLLIAAIMRKDVFSIFRTKHDFILAVSYGLLGMLPVQYCYFQVIELANASIATILQFIGPFLILLYLGATKQQIIRPVDVMAIVLAFLSVFLLATHGKFNQLAITQIVLFWGFMSALGVCGNALLPPKLLKNNSAIVTSGWGMLFSGIALVIVRPHMPAVSYTEPVITNLALVIVIGTIIPFTIITLVLRHIKPSTVGLLDAFEPVSATLGSVLFFGLMMSPSDWIGTILVIASTMIINIQFKSKKIKRKKL
ncbi:MAG: EamA family transporter [Lactobacillus sp.]|nr:EamA family transporter [Lactobacillus sp.]